MWELGLSPIRGEEEVKVERFKIRASYDQICILEKDMLVAVWKMDRGEGLGLQSNPGPSLRRGSHGPKRSDSGHLQILVITRMGE